MVTTVLNRPSILKSSLFKGDPDDMDVLRKNSIQWDKHFPCICKIWSVRGWDLRPLTDQAAQAYQSTIHRPLLFIGGMKTYSLISPKVSRNPQTPTGRSKKCHLELCWQFERRGGAEGKIQAYLPQGMVRIGGEGTAQSRKQRNRTQSSTKTEFCWCFCWDFSDLKTGV